MPLLGRVRGSSAEGPGGRPPSFPRKRVDGAQASWYVWNGRYGKIELDPILTDQRQRRTYGNGERYFYVSYGVLTEFLRMNVILAYFCNGQRRYGNGYVTVETTHDGGGPPASMAGCLIGSALTAS